MGYSYERKGDYRNARHYYFKSFQIPSGFSDINHQLPVYQNIGRYLIYIEKDPHLAKNYMVEGLQEYPTNVTLLMLLAQSELNVNDKTNALLSIQKAYELTQNANIRNIYQMIAADQKVDIPIWTFYSIYTLPANTH